MAKAIDYWCNPFTPEHMSKMKSHPEQAAVIEWWHMEERWKGNPVDEFVSILDEAGVEKVVVPAAQIRSIQSQNMFWDFSVEEIAEVVAKRPDRIAGLYGINPFKRMGGVRELESAVKEHGFVGAHLHPYGFERPINHRDYYPYYAKCVELDVPVVMQVGHSAEKLPSEMGRPILIDDVALYFPELRIVASHTGWPWVEELIAMAWKHPNVYIGCGAHAPKYWDKSLVAFMNSRGKGKVLWGTDFPIVNHKDSVSQVEELGLKEDAKVQLLREVAVKVFKL